MRILVGKIKHRKWIKFVLLWNAHRMKEIAIEIFEQIISVYDLHQNAEQSVKIGILLQ